jgi:hypothetical protein
MRVHQIHCPKCDTTLKSKAGMPVGQSISCPKCKHKFAVPAVDEPDVIDDADVVADADVVEERPPAKRKGPPPVPARKKAARDDEEDEEVRRPRKQSASARRRDRDDEDDDADDRRRRKKGRGRRDGDKSDNLYWRLRRNVAVRVITLVVLLGILAVLAYLLYEKKKAERELNGSSLDSPAFAAAVEHPQSAPTAGPAVE